MYLLPVHLFFNGSILIYVFIAPSIYCIVTKNVWRNNFSGPGTIILKVNFLCINGTRKPLLIHGFSPVNARLLTVYGTAFYAINFNISRTPMRSFCNQFLNKKIYVFSNKVVKDLTS